MTKNKYSHCDDVSDVTGVNSKDKLLFIGPPTMSFMKKYVNELVEATSPEDLDSEHVRNSVYDKVFVGCDVKIDEDLISKIANLNIGLMVFFVEDEGTRKYIKNYVDTHWYSSNSWTLTSNVGKCLVTNAKGKMEYTG